MSVWEEDRRLVGLAVAFIELLALLPLLRTNTSLIKQAFSPFHRLCPEPPLTWFTSRVQNPLLAHRVL